MATWQVQEARTRLSEIIRLAESQGAQTITRRGTECVVVISAAEYRNLTSGKPDLVDFLLNSGPKFDDPDAIFDRSLVDAYIPPEMRERLEKIEERLTALEEQR
jgi:prevent-host-death family protein